MINQKDPKIRNLFRGFILKLYGLLDSIIKLGVQIPEGSSLRLQELTINVCLVVTAGSHILHGCSDLTSVRASHWLLWLFCEVIPSYWFWIYIYSYSFLILRACFSCWTSALLWRNSAWTSTFEGKSPSIHGWESTSSNVGLRLGSKDNIFTNRSLNSSE